MPLQPQTTISSPNAIMVPAITLMTKVEGGALRTSAHIQMSPAIVEADENFPTGKWQKINGQDQTITIDNVESLDADLAHLQNDVLTVMGLIVKLVDDLNAVRKVI